jgi:integrase
MATIKERTAKDGSIRYTCEVRLKGFPRQTATFKRKTDAKKWIAATESAIREGRHFKTAEAKRHTFIELADRYLNTAVLSKTSAQQLNWWKDRLGPNSLADITPALITQYRDEIANTINYKGVQNGPATVARYMSILSGAFTVAVRDWEWLEASPLQKVTKPKLPQGRVRFLDDDERASLLNACRLSSNEWLYMCVILALSTGMRQGELMGLKWADVDLKSRCIILEKTKNGDRRRVPLAGHALELLQEHAKVRRLDTQLLFPSSRHPDRPIDLRKPFENALQAAGIVNFHWHDLRHCTASYLAMNGASLAEIAEILGHKTLQMVKRYAHLSDGHVSSVVESMNSKIFGGV